MAYPYELIRQSAGATEDDIRLLVNASTDTAALSDPNPTNTEPTAGSGIAAVDHYPCARFWFGGVGDANDVINYQVILWTRAHGAGTAYTPTVVAKGAVTLGTDVYTATGLGTATKKFADTITDTVATAGTYIKSPADNTRAYLEVPTLNAHYIQVQTDRSTGDPTSADVFMQLGEPSPTAIDVAIADAGALATAAHQVTLNSALVGASAPTIDSYTTAVVDCAAAANQVLVADPGASKQIWVYGFVGHANVAGTITFQDEDDTALSGTIPVGANGGLRVEPSGNFAQPWLKCTTNKALELDCATCTIDGIITYAIVSV